MSNATDRTTKLTELVRDAGRKLVDSAREGTRSLRESVSFRTNGGTETVRTGAAYHVLPHEDVWVVRREGTDVPAEQRSTKLEAVRVGREIARKAEGQLVIHRTDGTIQDRHTYGGTNGG